MSLKAIRIIPVPKNSVLSWLDFWVIRLKISWPNFGNFSWMPSPMNKVFPKVLWMKRKKRYCKDNNKFWAKLANLKIYKKCFLIWGTMNHKKSQLENFLLNRKNFTKKRKNKRRKTKKKGKNMINTRNKKR